MKDLLGEHFYVAMEFQCYNPVYYLIQTRLDYLETTRVCNYVYSNSHIKQVNRMGDRSKVASKIFCQLEH